MKLGCAINAFEGTELLKYQIQNIRKHIDLIIVVYQRHSYYGHPILESDLQNINKLLEEKLVDKIIEFKFDTFATNSPEARKIEKEKRNFARQIIIDSKCSHFLDLDSDEFYIEKEFILAKNKIEKENLDFTVVNYINYYNKPIFRGINKTILEVPFICKIYPNITIGSGHGKFKVGNRFVSEDLTRGYDTTSISTKNYIFNSNEIMMHHMSYVRKNLKRKFEVGSGTKIEGLDNLVVSILQVNSSTKTFNAKPLYRTEESIVEVPNQFNIPLDGSW